LPRFADTKLVDAERGLVAPMPGMVVSVEVQVGDAVGKGQLLMVLEAMKMEHRITAPRDGIVSEIHVVTGDQVANGELLVRLAEDREE
jgi:biotin carboxyl carrier protein